VSAYCAQADMQARYDTRLLIQLTDLPTSDQTPPATTITAGVLDQAVADASGEIDSYLATVYTLPLVGGTPAPLLPVACTLTLGYLYQRNGIAVPQHIADSMSAARSWLKRLADRTVRLYPDAQDDPAGQAEGAGMPQTNELRRDFSMRNLKDVL
jgi:phage gp36-like protein